MPPKEAAKIPIIRKVCTLGETWRKEFDSGKSIKISQTNMQRKFAPTCNGSVISNGFLKKPAIKA